MVCIHALLDTQEAYILTINGDKKRGRGGIPPHPLNWMTLTEQGSLVWNVVNFRKRDIFFKTINSHKYKG